MITPEFRPVIDSEGYGGRYSTLSELTERDFRALFDAYMSITDVTTDDAHEMTLGEFLRSISDEADIRGYFD